MSETMSKGTKVILVIAAVLLTIMIVLALLAKFTVSGVVLA